MFLLDEPLLDDEPLERPVIDQVHMRLFELRRQRLHRGEVDRPYLVHVPNAA